MADLFTKQELESFHQRRHDDAPTDDIPDDVSAGIADATFDVVRRMVSAWLLDATKLPQLPQDHDLIWSWALELAALAVENPTSTTSQTTLGITKQWSNADAQRRSQILSRAHAWAREQETLPEDNAPVGSFPGATRLPSDVVNSHGLSRPWGSW